MSAAGQTQAVPQVRLRRLLQVGLSTVAVVGVVVAVTMSGLWAWGPLRWTDAYAQRFGDPRVFLADGAAISSTPSTATTWKVEPTTFGLPDSTAALADAFGGPAVTVRPGIVATRTGTVDYSLVDLSQVQADWTNGAVSAIRFSGASADDVPTTPRLRTESERIRELRRIAEALGWPAAAASAAVVAIERSGDFTSYYLAPASGLADDIPGMWLAATYDADGVLRHALLWLQRPAEPRQDVATISAQQALDNLVHHRDAQPLMDDPNWWSRWGDRLLGLGARPPTPGTDGITSARLVTAEPWLAPSGSDRTGVYWEFLAGDEVVGMADATPETTR